MKWIPEQEAPTMKDGWAKELPMDTIIADQGTLRDRVKRILRGLHAPKSSGDHKYAMYALTRLFGPSTISLMACLGVLCADKALISNGIQNSSRIFAACSMMGRSEVLPMMILTFGFIM